MYVNKCYQMENKNVHKHSCCDTQLVMWYGVFYFA